MMFDDKTMDLWDTVLSFWGGMKYGYVAPPIYM